MGLTVDEAHYVLYGQHLALSYFDHPPMVGWVHALFHLLPLSENIQARLPAMLLSILTSWLVYHYLLKKGFTRGQSSTATLGLNMTPLFNSLSVALLPDTLLMPLTILIVQETEDLLENSSVKKWLRLGLWLGLAGLSKYTAILYVIALVLIFAAKGRWRELLKPGFWCGSLVAAVIVAPVLLWNLRNDFISFKYQTGHVAGANTDHLKTFFSSIGIQIASWGILPFFVALWGHAHIIKQMLKTREMITRYLTEAVFGSVFLVFFISVSVREVLLPHWMLIYFTLMLPLAVATALLKYTAVKKLTAVFAVSGLLSLTLLVETAFHVLPARAEAGLYHDIMGWPELIDGAVARLNLVESSTKGIAVMNWSLGSRATYYAYDRSPVFVLDQRYDQFDIWNPVSPIGYDLILLIEAEKKDEQLARVECESIREVGDKLTTIKDIPVHHFLYYYCAKLKSVKE